jgi:hypothetical protein
MIEPQTAWALLNEARIDSRVIDMIVEKPWLAPGVFPALENILNLRIDADSALVRPATGPLKSRGLASRNTPLQTEMMLKTYSADLSKNWEIVRNGLAAIRVE